MRESICWNASPLVIAYVSRCLELCHGCERTNMVLSMAWRTNKKKSLCCGTVAWLSGRNTEVIQFAELWYRSRAQEGSPLPLNITVLYLQFSWQLLLLQTLVFAFVLVWGWLAWLWSELRSVVFQVHHAISIFCVHFALRNSSSGVSVTQHFKLP